MFSRFLCTLVCVLSVSASCLATSFPAKYDRHIKASAGRYLPGIDWRLLKAQYYQESHLDPEAISPVGAAGIAQFMPATWAEIASKMQMVGVSTFSAIHSIDGGAYYMAKMRRSWKSKRPEADRHSLAMASYNAGLGNILKAQKHCDGVLLYVGIIECLPAITGRHSAETITYVRRIWGYYTIMIVGG